MILSYIVNVKISNNQIKYYKNRGYDVKGGNEMKEINVEDLPTNSSVKIKVKCDYCDNEKYISLGRYMINTEQKTKPYACSQKCMQHKVKNTNLKKYGVDNVSKSQEIKEKKIKTCLLNYEVEYPQQSKIIFDKGLNTKFEKYGDRNYNNIIKRENTCIEKYGYYHPMKNENVVEKLKLKLINILKNKILKEQKYKNLNIIDFNHGTYNFLCDCGEKHDFDIDYKLLWQRMNSKTILCTICNPIDKHISGKEKNLLKFIKENYDGEIIESDRNILYGKELDIYLPELNIAFEFNGLYWHSELYKDKNYHLNKTGTCLEKGIQLIHIWEDDFYLKTDIIKSMILNKLRKNINKIYARTCEIKEINDNKIIKDFLDKNHIQGFVVSSIKIGLYYNNEIVSLMIFGKKDGECELLRFCNKLNTNVIGGASKLFKYFIKKYNREITTYTDRSYSNGDLYKQLGFNFLYKTEPNYYYIVNDIRKNKFDYRKEMEINRIYDSGDLKFIYKLN